MALDQHAANLVSLTKKAFGGDANSVSMTDGISLIDSWTSFLKTDPSAGTDVLAGLDDLRKQLTTSSPDTTQVQHILQHLSQQTEKLAGSIGDDDDKSTLTALAGSLNGFSQQIGGTGHPAPTGGEAPMTSTVGGESSRSGTGASALTDDDDDLSDREGGTRDDIDYMDDTTGSDGGIRESEAEGDSAYSPSTGNSSAQSSRSDSSRVSGMGVSGGTADSDSAQSEGRSQY